MNGGKKFTKLDLAQEYNQVKLEEASRELTVIKTHKGTFAKDYHTQLLLALPFFKKSWIKCSMDYRM